MNRRHFLYGAGLAGAALLGGGSGVLFFTRQVDCMGFAYSDLPKNIRALYHEDFVDAFPDTTLEEVVRELRDLEVCTWRGFSTEQVRSNAADDPLVEFNDMFWTKSELLVYAVVARLHLMCHPREK